MAHAQNKGSQDARKKIDMLKRTAQKYATACIAYDKVYQEYTKTRKFPPLLNRLATDRSSALQALAEAALDANGCNASHAEGIRDLV
jgi:hypothetical protein